jgi:pyridoxal phosphate enzyme (YggS family)
MRDRVAAVRERIARAAGRAGRKAEEIRLVAVSKMFPAAAVREAFTAGLRDFGENKVQEADGKFKGLEDLRDAGARFHLVGHLQSNKARKAVALFDRIHSLDSVELALKLEQQAVAQGKIVHVLVQVDLGKEETKSGLEEPQLLSTLEQLRGLKAVRVDGLMTLPPFSQDPEQARPFFRRLREHRDKAQQAGLILGGELSMGMSHDLEVAIEEGASLVRVGTAIFGTRTRPSG